MNSSRRAALDRLLHPQSVAIAGGEHARRCIAQLQRLGFSGKIWPVNPNRTEMAGVECVAALEDLPSAPDAAFLAVGREATIESVRKLRQMGAGGAVCYASGFAEEGLGGQAFQSRLDSAMGLMPLIGPNCYGLLNYIDGVALWPDQQGGQRCRRGVAIISQSGNIALNLSMQRRSLPVAYLISTGNMSGIKMHEYIRTLVAQTEVTAIGIYTERIDDARALSQAALEALDKNIPIVVLDSGRSRIGADLTQSHSHSMSGDARLNRAFYAKYGFIQVSSIPQLLETLKFVSYHRGASRGTLASISCSGGEAALVADLADTHGMTFPAYDRDQHSQLRQVLGDRVPLSNPLDYHTYIWGDPAAQKKCFEAVFSGPQTANLVVLDYPEETLRDASEWDLAVQAVAQAADSAHAMVAVVSSLHENMPESVQHKIKGYGMVPMLGLEECIGAIAGAWRFTKAKERLTALAPLSPGSPSLASQSLSEYQSKQILRQAGIQTVDGMLARTIDELGNIAGRLGYPLVAKVSGRDIVHKTEVDGVIVDIHNEAGLIRAFQSLAPISGEVLIEKRAPPPLLECLVGLRKHEKFGYILVVGAGGQWTELLDDTSVLLLPVDQAELRDALAALKIGRLLSGYRGPAADTEALVQAVMRLIGYCTDKDHILTEVEVNPLFVYAETEGIVAVDAVVRGDISWLSRRLSSQDSQC